MTDILVTQTFVEAIAANAAADVRVTQVFAQAITANAAADVRATQVYAEVLVDRLTSEPPPFVRVTQIQAEVLTANASADVRCSQVYLEAIVNSLTTVPNVLGMTLPAATATLLAAGLVLGTVTGAGVVVVQTIAPGAIVPFGTAVSLELQLDPVVITPTTLPNPETDTPYGEQLTARGGFGGPYTFSLVAGGLPAGLTLSPTGLIGGTTPAAAILAPTAWPPALVDQLFQHRVVVIENPLTVSTFTVRATDVGARFGEQAYTLAVQSGWTSAVYTLVPPSTLPSCVRLRPDGRVEGYPMTVGSWTVTVLVTGPAGLQHTETYTLAVTSS